MKHATVDPAKTPAAEKGGVSIGANAPARQRFHFMDDEAIERLPPIKWLVDGMLPAGGLAVVFAPPESFKTFFALSLAFSVATETPFFGRNVRRGSVVYIAGEGSAGLPVRIGAWKHSYERPGRAGVYFLDEPVQLLEPNVVATFLAAVDTLPSRPQLIVLDTLALCMAGSDEGTGDMSTAIEAMRFIRRQTGATIVAQHHTRLDAERERGSTNLRGGVETMISLKREGQSITVACEKQKDAAKFSPLTLELIEVRDSCALITAQTGDAVSVLFPSDPRHQALRILHESSLADGLSTTAWLKASGMKDRTFYKARKQLVTMGYVDSAKGRGGMNRVTGQGELAL